MRRDMLWFALGCIVAVIVGYPMAERHIAWQYRTLACWPENDIHTTRNP